MNYLKLVTRQHTKILDCNWDWNNFKIFVISSKRSPDYSSNLIFLFRWC